MFWCDNAGPDEGGGFPVRRGCTGRDADFEAVVEFSCRQVAEGEREASGRVLVQEREDGIQQGGYYFLQMFYDSGSLQIKE